MSNEVRTFQSEEDNPDEELTRLEWAASQRQLSPDEMRRLNDLRQHPQDVWQAVQDRVEPVDGGNPVMDGDDSP